MKVLIRVDLTIDMDHDRLRLLGDAARATIWETIRVSRFMRAGSEWNAARRRQQSSVDLLCPSDRQYMELRLRLDEPSPRDCA